MMMRLLERHELDTIWTIDRSEVIDSLYKFADGMLALTPMLHEVQGWKPGTVESRAPQVLPCFERGGSYIGMFDDDRLVGFACVDSEPLGLNEDQRQLKWLYVSAGYRNLGAGRRLLEESKSIARTHGAQYLYISATPSKNTVDFYIKHGAMPTENPDPKLFALEPEDIHLLCAL